MSNEVLKLKKQRIDWIDIGKAIAIFSVVYIHTVPNKMIFKVISSFIIPFFFMASAVTYKFAQDGSSFKLQLKKTIKHLLVPAFIMILITTLLNLILHEESRNITFLQNKLLSVLYASGVSVQLKDTIIPPIGVVWFFFALAFGRTFLDLIGLISKGKHLPVFVLLFTLAGVVVSYFCWLPFSIDVALGLLPFLYLGFLLKKIDFKRNTVLFFLLFSLIWGVSFFCVYKISGSFFEAARRQYPLFPLCHICAASGSMALAYFCEILTHTKLISKLFKFVGKNSLYYLCIHILDFSFPFLWMLTKNKYINGFIRVIFDLIIFFIVILIKNKIDNYRNSKLNKNVA